MKSWNIGTSPLSPPCISWEFTCSKIVPILFSLEQGSIYQEHIPEYPIRYIPGQSKVC